MNISLIFEFSLRGGLCGT